jgi:hypothetical protein
MEWRQRTLLVPAATPAFRLRSWRAFQVAIDPLGQPRVLPHRQGNWDDARLSLAALAAATAG